MSFIKDIFNRLCLDRIKSRNDETDETSNIIYNAETKLNEQPSFIVINAMKQ